MNVNWLLERDTFEENLEPMVEAIKQQGMVCKIHDYVPFEGDEAYLKLFGKEDCVVFYGSLQFADQIRKQTKWIPGLYYTKPRYDCVNYYPALGELLLAQSYIMLPYGCLKRQRDFLFEHVGNNNAVFIRPSSGHKLFTGKVVLKEDYEKDVDFLGFYDVPPETVVVVSEPRNLTNEWRFVIVDGKVVAGSQYKNDVGTKLSEDYPAEAAALAQKAAGLYNPDRAWVMDICQTKDGEYFVLEIGAFSCAGLYVCNKSAVVRAVSRIALEEWQTYQVDV
jgi:hypothetical protein